MEGQRKGSQSKEATGTSVASGANLQREQSLNGQPSDDLLEAKVCITY